MLKSTNFIVGAIVTLSSLSLGADPTLAGVFDFLHPASTDQVSRAQSPVGGYAISPAPTTWQPGAGYSTPPAAASDSGPGWGHSPAACFNCGECDPHQGWLEFHRRQCHQTYYPRSAPYCQTDWGWHQSCWRRMNDNYNCQRPDSRGSIPSAGTPMAPAVPVMPRGVPPAATTYRQPPHTAAPNRFVGYGRGTNSMPAADTSRAAPPARDNVLPGGASNAGPGGWTEIEEPIDRRGPQLDDRQTGIDRTGYFAPQGYR